MSLDSNQWYIATLIIKSRVADDGGPFLCDEQIRLINAPSAEIALMKAIQIGKAEETSYKNADGEQVIWTFVGVEFIEALDEGLSDGLEIRSRLFRHRQPERLVSDGPQSQKKSIRDEDIPEPDE